MAQHEKKSLHEGHRARMRARVRAAGEQSLADHELLELLLYYALPRRDTNGVAHELIEECGSLHAVLEAPEERLCRVPAVGNGAAQYLRLLGELSRRYTLSKTTQKSDPMQKIYDTPEKIATLMYPYFLGQSKECMYALLFDPAMRLCDVFRVAEGSVNSVGITLRAVTQRAYQRNAASVVLAHNHPGGIASPSEQDIALTRDLYGAFSLMGIPLVEHFVFTEQAYFPILAGCDGIRERQTEDGLQAAQLRRLIGELERGGGKA